jgi:hypothetical protein
MKKIIIAVCVLLVIENVIAQKTETKSVPTAVRNIIIPKFNIYSEYKSVVVHDGYSGALIKGAGYSVLDIDSETGNNGVRFGKQGSDIWFIGSYPYFDGSNDYLVSPSTFAYPALIIKGNTYFTGIGTAYPSSVLEVSSGVANTDLRISSKAGFGSTRLSFISDKDLTSEWRPGFIASGDNGTFTGRLDFYTNGTGSNNKLGSALGMSVMNKRVTIGGGFSNSNPYILEVHPLSTNPYGILNFSDDNAKYWEQIVFFDGTFNLFSNNTFKGSFSPVTGAYTSSSDKSFKKNITSLSSVLDKVMSLKPSTYEYINNNPENRNSIGLIAQDVESFFPEFVYKNLDKRAGKEVYSMDYAGLSVIALKAIQEQQVMIKELQAEILKLKK